jgi:hypothetical protein
MSKSSCDTTISVISQKTNSPYAASNIKVEVKTKSEQTTTLVIADNTDNYSKWYGTYLTKNNNKKFYHFKIQPTVENGTRTYNLLTTTATTGSEKIFRYMTLIFKNKEKIEGSYFFDGLFSGSMSVSEGYKVIKDNSDPTDKGVTLVYIYNPYTFNKTTTQQYLSSCEFWKNLHEITDPKALADLQQDDYGSNTVSRGGKLIRSTPRKSKRVPRKKIRRTRRLKKRSLRKK